MNIGEASFLKAVDNDRNKVTYTRIEVLDSMERPIKTIEGRVLDGSSISLNGNSSVRRTATLNLIADEAVNDLTSLENFLSINRKIKIFQGVKYNFDLSKDILRYKVQLPIEGEFGKIYFNRTEGKYYIWSGGAYTEVISLFNLPEEIIWFPLGVYVINQPNITHSLNGINISLNLKDKMCLLNGENGGGLPTSITFHEYDQVIGEVVCTKDPRTDSDLNKNEYTIYKYNNNYYSWTRKYGWTDSDKSEIGQIVSIPQLFYDIILTVVVRFGNESPSRVIINDVPREIKQLVRWTSSSPLYYNVSSHIYTANEDDMRTDKQENPNSVWVTYNFNDDIGYVYTDFTYPGQLISNIGDTVTSVLDKIIQQLGNYEYFYDVNGNFIFQEKRNYLNTSYLPTEKANQTTQYYLDNNRKIVDEDGNSSLIELLNNDLCIIGQDNFKADFYGDQKSVYTFGKDDKLISTYTNNPMYTNIKNDYHIWGKNNDGYAIHYHLVIKDKPVENYTYIKNGVYRNSFTPRQVIFLKKEDDPNTYSGMIRLAESPEAGVADTYTPNDWRAELYMQGLEIQRGGGRPDIYQQELLDLFDSIYEWGYYNDNNEFIKEGRFKADITQNPNSLQYFLDYLNPTDNLYALSVDDIGTKMYSYQQDKIIRLYDREVPNNIILDDSMDRNYKIEIQNKSNKEGQPFSVVSAKTYALFAIGTVGYSAQETVRNYLYQYTSYNENISLQCIPIYYLDVNRRITVEDKQAGINSDYIITSITMPLNIGASMSISAIKALNRLPDDGVKEIIAKATLQEPYLYIHSDSVVIDGEYLYDTVGDVLSLNNDYIVANEI